MTRTIQVTIDEDLLRRVDLATSELGIARSALVRQALEMALRELAISELERRHAEGYQRFPVIRGEFDAWESEQAWGEP